jgi:predicted phage-related endonuclease
VNKVDGLNLFHCAAFNRNQRVDVVLNDKMVEFLFDFLVKSLGRDSAVAMLHECDPEQSRNIFHLSVENKNSAKVNSFLSLVRSKSTDEEAKALLMAKTKNNENLIELAVKSGELSMVKQVFCLFKKVKLSNEEMKTLTENLNEACDSLVHENEEDETEIRQYLESEVSKYHS